MILLVTQGRSRNEIVLALFLSLMSASVFKGCVYKAWWIRSGAVASHPLIGFIEQQHRYPAWLEFLWKINRETPKHLPLHLIVDNYAAH